MKPKAALIIDYYRCEFTAERTEKGKHIFYSGYSTLFLDQLAQNEGDGKVVCFDRVEVDFIPEIKNTLQIAETPFVSLEVAKWSSSGFIKDMTGESPVQTAREIATEPQIATPKQEVSYSVVIEEEKKGQL